MKTKINSNGGYRVIFKKYAGIIVSVFGALNTLRVICYHLEVSNMKNWSSAYKKAW